MKRNKSILVTALLSGLVIGLVFMLQMQPIVDKTIIDMTIPREWRDVKQIQYPDVGASGCIGIRIYPHDADPGTTYASNVTNVSSYAYGLRNQSMTGEVPRDTTFDIVITMRWNETHAYNLTSGVWNLAWVRVNMTSAELAIGALTAMTEVNITQSLGEDLEYIFVNYYLNKGGLGYTIPADALRNCTYQPQAYF